MGFSEFAIKFLVAKSYHRVGIHIGILATFRKDARERRESQVFVGIGSARGFRLHPMVLSRYFPAVLLESLRILG